MIRRYVTAGLAVVAVASSAPAAVAQPLYCVEVQRQQVLLWEIRPVTVCVL